MVGRNLSPSRNGNYSFRHQVQTVSAAPSLLSSVHRDCFPQGYNGWGMSLTIGLYIMP